MNNEEIAQALGWKRVDAAWWRNPRGEMVWADHWHDGGSCLPDFICDISAAMECWHALKHPEEWRLEMTLARDAFVFVNMPRLAFHINDDDSTERKRYWFKSPEPAYAICAAFMAEVHQ